MKRAPQRIVCLSAEAADWLWRLGEWERVVGVTGFFTPPPGAPPKPRVSGFSTAKLKQIGDLKPDLILTFSDVQAPLAAQLIDRGFTVLATNQRTLAEIENTLTLLARIVDRDRAGESLLRKFRERLAPEETTDRPRVYFEEWNDPLISGIAWVSELIERAGGRDILAELRNRRAALERVVTPARVCWANPEIIFASWCGKPVKTAAIAARRGWNNVAAVRHNRIHEIPGQDILQPGFRLVFGYERMKELIHAGAAVNL
jgi:iron complex transport system substrate-binding protein